MNKKNSFIICLIAIVCLVLSSCELVPAINTNNNQVVELNKDSHVNNANIDNTSKDDSFTDNNSNQTDSSEQIDNSDITSEEETYDWDDSITDWDYDTSDWDDDIWIDGDEIIDLNEFEEVPFYACYEYGDWTMADMEDGTWSAWRYNGSDETVTIPTTYNDAPVKQVGVWAFWNNTTLKHVIIPEGITIINENCFMGCENLEIADLPSHLDVFGNQIFSDCSSLKRCVVPDGITELEYRQFDNCTSLEEVVLPANMTLISEGAFSDCINLKTIYFRGSEADWKGIEISQNALCDSNYTVVYNYSGD